MKTHNHNAQNQTLPTMAFAQPQTAYISLTAVRTETVILRISNRRRQPGGIDALPENHVPGFIEAKQYLHSAQTSGNTLPKAVIIDQPLLIDELKSFTKWVSKSSSLKHIPIVYNQACLSGKEIRDLAAMRVVDDMVDLQKNYGILAAKCAFLQKAKLIAARNKSRNKLFSYSVLRLAERKVDRGLRRLLDIAISAVVILMLLPIFIIVAIAIRLESKGPILYNSPRAGKGYKVFKFYKFRTMSVDADARRKELEQLNLYQDEGGAKFFKIENDPRITKVGAFLRNTSLDELPQLFNVLKGDMCLVGNRPLPLYEASTLTTNESVMRFMAPAGITGLWQIEKRGKADMSVSERIDLDITYAHNNNLLQDLRIIVRTPTAMFQKANV